MNIIMNKPFLISLIAATFLLVFQYCSKQAENEPDSNDSGIPVTEAANETKTEKVEVMILKNQEVDQSITYTSNLTAFEEIYLASSSPSKIEKIYVVVGDHVKKGQLLVQMDRTRLQQAIIQLKNLETDLSRLDTLIKTNTIPQQQYDQVKAQYDVAKSNVDFLEENTQLRATLNGIVTGKYYEDGEFYSGAPNTAAGKAAIISIMQVNPLKAIVNISEQYFPAIEKSMNADILCEIYPNETFKGKVYRIHPTLDPMSRTFEVEVSIPNPNEKLRPGMYSKVALHLGRSEALLVPAIAVLKLQGSNVKYVFVNNNGKAKMIEVTIGRRFDDQLEIISDELREGDQLIVTGQSKLVDDVPIEISNNI